MSEKFIIHFNSIKVRLRLATSNPPSAVPMLFQFHKGSIKTREKKDANGKVLISIP